MLLDDLPMVSIAGGVLVMILLGLIKLSIGRPERRCVDCMHFRAADGMCLNAGRSERDLVTGVVSKPVVSAAWARQMDPENGWCGYGAHRFEARPADGSPNA